MVLPINPTFFYFCCLKALKIVLVLRVFVYKIVVCLLLLISCYIYLFSCLRFFVFIFLRRFYISIVLFYFNRFFVFIYNCKNLLYQ